MFVKICLMKCMYIVYKASDSFLYSIALHSLLNFVNKNKNILKDIHNRSTNCSIYIRHSIFDFLYLLGTPETSRSGRSTLKARKAFTSKPSIFSLDNTVLTILECFM